MECGKDWKKTLKNRSPGTLKIMVLLGRVTKKTIKMKSWMECGKDWKNTEKWKPWNFENHGFAQRGCKKILPPWSKKLQKWSRTCVQNRMKIFQLPFWAQGRKDNKKKHKKQHKLYQQTSPKGEPRTWFSHLKMHPGGFSSPLGSKTPPHGPKTPPNHDLLLICVPSALICRRFLVHIFK